MAHGVREMAHRRWEARLVGKMIEKLQSLHSAIRRKGGHSPSIKAESISSSQKGIALEPEPILRVPLPMATAKDLEMARLDEISQAEHRL